ncbi:(2Fe-2S)-binding protein [Rhizomicrobium palustre]|jgi:bacterioferritin-associated ferredoxin|uniref:(2Fe-2S)-binding protein n=1 Tax=Rhizomicrobium palustre TaxID=189966 RepID=UPI001423F957
MIICVCNNLNNAKVESAIEAGARSADEVYAHCGVKRNCGRCQETIQQMVETLGQPVLAAAE